VQTVTQPPQEIAPQRFKADYSFVNWIRCIAMMSIVYEHCLAVPGPPEGTSELVLTDPYAIFTSGQALASLLIMQPFKFGTICFFMISGFLLGRRLNHDQSPWTYYKRRLRVVGVPFLIAFSLFYGKSIAFGLISSRYTVDALTVPFLTGKLWLMLFHTAYWFIADFLVALAILFLFWRYTRSRWFGWITGGIALLYALNVYMVWFESGHTLAIPAYIFYLWIGVYIARTPNLIERLQQLPSLLTTTVLLLTLLLSLAEAYYLKSMSNGDPGNTLRLSNQLFSVATFVWLLGHNILDRLPFLNPRSEAFGIYLYHLFFIAVLAKVILLFPGLAMLDYQPGYSGGELAACTVVRFLIIYTSTLLFVKAVNRTRFKWLFGN
jgi:Acyltransferase family